MPPTTTLLAHIMKLYDLQHTQHNDLIVPFDWGLMLDDERQHDKEQKNLKDFGVLRLLETAGWLIH